MAARGKGRGGARGRKRRRGRRRSGVEKRWGMRFGLQIPLPVKAATFPGARRSYAPRAIVAGTVRRRTDWGARRPWLHPKFTSPDLPHLGLGAETGCSSKLLFVLYLTIPKLSSSRKLCLSHLLLLPQALVQATINLSLNYYSESLSLPSTPQPSCQMIFLNIQPSLSFA